jgi:acetolactate synthase-1/2/3 large subunit
MPPVRRRLVNGVAGAIGGSLSFALRPGCAVAPVAVLGDGTIGFHRRIRNRVRRRLPVAVLGNDARWNAESQIQLRSTAASVRTAASCCRPLRSGGHGARRPRRIRRQRRRLPGAIERSLASGKPACINIESIAAPMLRRPG